MNAPQETPQPHQPKIAQDTEQGNDHSSQQGPQTGADQATAQDNEHPTQQEQCPAAEQPAVERPYACMHQEDPAQHPRLSTHFSPSAFTKHATSPLGRCAAIAFLTLLLMIPLASVENIIESRSERQYEATNNIAESWGKAQTISGPALVVPYEVWEDQKEFIIAKDSGEKQEVVRREYYTRHKIILPAEVNFDARLDPEIRYRGIYRLALYAAPVSIQGHFALPLPADFGKNIHAIHWENAWLALGISDLKSIFEESPMQWNGKPALPYQPGTKLGGVLGAGFHAAVPMQQDAAGTRQNFSMQLNVRGSGGLSFTPVGEKSRITMAGTWPAPSFQGNLLPQERTITPQGFTAQWAISNLTRSYPQMSDLESKVLFNSSSDYEASEGASHRKSAITSFTTGVNLHEPVSLYRMTLRAVQYAELFIAVSFVALFAFEMITRQRMHLLQYGMVGLSMSLFYLVLLSLAEHIDFSLAFTAASAVTVAMNSLYIAAATQKKKWGALMGVLLTALYTLLYSLLRMEDNSLLLGTALVVLMMAVLMFVTRKLPQAAV